MMRRVVLLAVCCAMAVQVKAQKPEFKNGGFEGFEKCWDDKTFYTPKGKPFLNFKENYFLSTLNELCDLIAELADADITAYKLTGVNEVHEGNYSLRLVSGSLLMGSTDNTIFLPGAFGTLKIIIDGDMENGGDCEIGKPFTAKPTALSGYYKCLPKPGDAASIEIQLKRNGSILSEKKEVISETISNWTKFTVSLPPYTETPDEIVVIFSASAGYDFTDITTLLNCKGVVGSELQLDNLEFEYFEGVKEMFDPEIKLSVYPNPSKENISIQIAKHTNGTVVIYDYLTRKTGEYSISGSQIDIDIRDYAVGSYLINVIENGKVVTTGRFVKE